jgi:hypothetical protein
MDTSTIEEALEAAIVDDLQDPAITHAAISTKYRVGFNRITALAKKYNLTRRRGRQQGYKVKAHTYTNLLVQE